MDIFYFKVLAVLIVFSIGFASGLFPLRYQVTKSNQLFFSIGNSLAGGVFLGAGLLHLLPDGIELLANESQYPLALLLCALSLAVLLFIEKVLFIETESRDLDKVAEAPSYYPYLLAVVLSIHSFIAGITLGIEKAFMASIVLFIAIIAHKGSAAFALGISLRRAAIALKKHIRVVLLFSCMTPMGILFGSGIAELFSSHTGRVLEGVFDSLAAGTFLYVSVLDIIEEEFSIPGNEWIKFAAVICGLGLMAALAYIV